MIIIINGICNGDSPIKYIDVEFLAKWELKDEEALALLRSFVDERPIVHIENSTSLWYP